MFEIVTQVIKMDGSGGPTPQLNEHNIKAFKGKVDKKLHEGWEPDEFQMIKVNDGVLFVHTFKGCVQNYTVNGKKPLNKEK